MKKFIKTGEPFIWLTGGAVAISIIMIVAILLLIMKNGLGFFWPSDIALLTLKNNEKLLGQIVNREAIPQPGAEQGTILKYRIQLKMGNRDIYGLDFKWIDVEDIKGIDYPENALCLERREWGNMYGFVKELKIDGAVVSVADGNIRSALSSSVEKYGELHKRIVFVAKKEIGQINYDMERLRLKIRKLELEYGKENPAIKERIENISKEIEREKGMYEKKSLELEELYKKSREAVILMSTADGKEKEIPVYNVVRSYMPNDMGYFKKTGIYLSRLWEFVSDDPREANTEGGIFPAIFGTVMMVIIMSIAVVPLGVLAAIYLNEYARQGTLVKTVRIAVNNLAGVPSIVFGVFGIGFFIYFIGGTIDKLFFPEMLPAPTYGTGGILWASMTLALLTVPVVIVATEEGLSAAPREWREGSFALGATKFETIWKVILPSAAPGIMTGLILAMARAAGEVAPLMITGVVKLAPSLPLDWNYPFLHLERKFMHLGFHIYDVGFQSPNVEAAKPMVYTTTLLLIGVVVLLNIFAILIRNRLRKKYVSSTF
ncbi:MAG: phosphate ABC transporter, permease protein PstA [Nitrospinae bacterium RIFCSPLOWO2_02_FULL_39_110]|nr:MAG: phosphate ABC transporter, permease protein PstA [Nitrospinae bacterium RIFCSPHIGHO2_12_FULL_39_42]OGW02167.1 MAG: phosphate ABC transporter, permease protein PstA [Nitrospinae bacterium RIFCSPHIGHO2_02_FULL_39_82]OGW06677.1 MAG: phosphate ABC transporter, permease protein PstA [Nitrospinae bacterium RIFCSPLOWO2_02_FULL_39_110]OGW07228.1 MAG: phosphate ABC transporter, permease protein PstA [Nitrospinae bacterium RIFCSPLOWO2_02_39_17]OGW11935.1 MAG: phosphate ABC transporter, permease p